MCISLLPGDELGEFYVNVQYEGPVGSFDECISKQGTHLENVWGQVKAFLEKYFGTNFKAELITLLPKGAPPDAEVLLPRELRVKVSTATDATLTSRVSNQVKQ